MNDEKMVRVVQSHRNRETWYKAYVSDASASSRAALEK